MESNDKSGSSFGSTTHTAKKSHKPNIFSRLFFCWMCPVFITGNKRDVEEDDLIVPSKSFNSDRLGAHLER